MSTLLPLFVLGWLSLAALIAAAALAQLQPDAAPQGAAPGPDPAPAAPDPPPAPPAATPPAPPVPVAEPPAPLPTAQPPPVEPEPSPAPAPPAAVQAPGPPAPAANRPSARERRRARIRAARRREARRKVTPQDGSAPRRQRQARDARPAPDPLLRVDAVVPGGASGGDSTSGLLLLGAGALLALVLASGSLVSVASRASRGGTR